MKIDRPSKEPFKRLDCAERVSNFNEDLFNEFLTTLNQEDFITYPSYAEYGDIGKKIADYISIGKECISIGTGSDSCIKDLMQTTLKKIQNFIYIAMFPNVFYLWSYF